MSQTPTNQPTGLVICGNCWAWVNAPQNCPRCGHAPVQPVVEQKTKAAEA